MTELARGADLLLAEASYVNRVPEDSKRYLSSARQQGAQGAAAGVGHLLLTHLLPGTSPAAARAAARHTYEGKVSVATIGLVLDLG